MRDSFLENPRAVNWYSQEVILKQTFGIKNIFNNMGNGYEKNKKNLKNKTKLTYSGLNHKFEALKKPFFLTKQTSICPSAPSKGLLKNPGKS